MCFPFLTLCFDMGDNVFVFWKPCSPDGRLMFDSTFWTLYPIATDQRLQTFLTEGVATRKYLRYVIPVQLKFENE